MTRPESEKINVVFDKDLEKVLRDLMLFDDLIQRRIKCAFCNRVITMENLEYIFTRNDKIVIGCSDKNCKSTLRSSISKNK